MYTGALKQIIIVAVIIYLHLVGGKIWLDSLCVLWG